MSNPPDMLDPGIGNVLFDTWLVSRAVHSLIDDVIKPTGLDADEFAIYSRSPPVSSGQFLATSWVTNSRARVITVADTDPAASAGASTRTSSRSPSTATPWRRA